MKRLFAISILIISSILLNSCGTMYSPALNANVNETKIVLSQNNFKIVGQVQGQADAKYICGIGGLSRAALRTNAIDDMTSNANLRGSQTIANITTHQKVKVISPFFIKITYVATGYIVEFY